MKIKTGISVGKSDSYHTLPNDQFARVGPGGMMTIDWAEVRRREQTDEEFAGAARVLLVAFSAGVASCSP